MTMVGHPLRRHRYAVLLLALGLSISVCDAVSAFGESHVRARMVVDKPSIEAGDSLTAAIVLEMDDHWHTYWAFSGDAGLPTEVDWTLPEGVEAGPIQWPGPTRYTEAGDLTVFGYADRVALLTTLTASPESVLGPSVTLTAKVSWLVCADICIPGDTTLTVRLNARANDSQIVQQVDGRSVDQALIASARETMSLVWSEEDDHLVSWVARVRPTPDGNLDVEVSLKGMGSSSGMVDLFPLQPEGTYIEANARQVTKEAVKVRFRVVVYQGEDPPGRMDAVLAIPDNEEQIQYRRIQIDLAASGIDLLATDFSANEPQRSLWAYLLMALIGGLILNLMPCVLPVISLKVMALVSQAGEAPERVRQLGIAFSAGVVSTFLLLALVVVGIKSTGELIGWGFQFQSPLFLIGLASLVFVLGLSLFGVVTFRLPGGTSRLTTVADQQGLIGSFANGVLATILATPCTAPFLGTALGFAFAQPAATTIAIFAATGFGMALPYVLLALRPEWIRWLPAPGPWMEHFKQAMAFLLMATTVWLLWVLGRQLGMEAVVWTTSFLLCLAIAATLVGQWIDLRSSSRRRRIIWGTALAIGVLAYRLLIHPLLLDPTPIAQQSSASSGQWQDFDRRHVEELIGQGRTVFIDFTADWCWTCKVNERVVLADSDVQKAFAEGNVALIKADWTHRQPEITQMLHAFGRPGVPLYVIFAAGRADEPIVLPEVITPDLVLNALRQARSPSL